jgi:hypothetical protein
MRLSWAARPLFGSRRSPAIVFTAGCPWHEVTRFKGPPLHLEVAPSDSRGSPAPEGALIRRRSVPRVSCPTSLGQCCPQLVRGSFLDGGIAKDCRRGVHRAPHVLIAIASAFVALPIVGQGILRPHLAILLWNVRPVVFIMILGDTSEALR